MNNNTNNNVEASTDTDDKEFIPVNERMPVFDRKFPANLEFLAPLRYANSTTARTAGGS